MAQGTFASHYPSAQPWRGEKKALPEGVRRPPVSLTAGKDSAGVLALQILC